MVGRHGRKCVKSEELYLQCEWDECREVYTDLSDFYAHLNNHYGTNCSMDAVQNPTGTLSCKWNECVFMTNCHTNLLRHLYFHGYHTKVKWWGMLCLKKEKLGECRALHSRNIIPELPEGFRCEWTDCLMLFDIPDQFYMHVYDHAIFAEEEPFQKNLKEFVCHWEGCSYVYETKSANKTSIGRFKLREHLRSHTKERCYACPWCGNLYVNRTKFTDHLNRQINIESHCFQCTHCSRTFATERLLKDHMRHHVNHYKCPKCAMTCPNPSGLKHHMRYKHSDERPYACQYCPYKSKTAYDLQVHMTFHQSDLSYRCHVEGCDYAVRSLQNLRYHFRTKHMIGKGKCYACHLCSKKYGVGFQLTHHLRTAHSFQWPPGHSRFKYKECEDGLLRLQTFRFESVELTEELMVDDHPPAPSEAAHAKNGKKRVARTKAPLARKRKLPTKFMSSSTITTRSASLILQKAQNQRSKPTTRVRKNLNKKKVPLNKSAMKPCSSTSMEDIDFQETTFLDEDSSFECTKEPPSEKQNCRVIEVVEEGAEVRKQQEVPGNDNTSALPSNPDCQSQSKQSFSSSEISALPSDMPLPERHAPEGADQLAMVDGTLASDDNGELISVMVDGEKYYLVQGKGKDDGKSITYCLVNASKKDTLTA